MLSSNTGSDFIYYLNGDNIFISEAIEFVSPSNFTHKSPTMNFADFNNDGELDILLDVTQFAIDRSILLFKNDGVYDMALASFDFGQSITNTVVNDIDLEGDLEIVYGTFYAVYIKKTMGMEPF